MILALLAFLFLASWPAVTLDCSGRPELAVTYGMLLFEARVEGYATDGTGAVEPVYARHVSYLTSDVPQIGFPDPPEPALNEVVYISEPWSIDGAGNSSFDPCTGR